jgi:hypothetical protein
MQKRVAPVNCVPLLKTGVKGGGIERLTPAFV